MANKASINLIIVININCVIIYFRGHYVISNDVILVLAPSKIVAYNLLTGNEAWAVDTPWTGYVEV